MVRKDRLLTGNITIRKDRSLTGDITVRKDRRRYFQELLIVCSRYSYSFLFSECQILHFFLVIVSFSKCTF